MKQHSGFKNRDCFLQKADKSTWLVRGRRKRIAPNHKAANMAAWKKRAQQNNNILTGPPNPAIAIHDNEPEHKIESPTFFRHL
jgi:hypothetical protein